jgi:hypothetical protein
MLLSANMPERVTYAVIKDALVPMGIDARAVHERLDTGRQVHVEIFQIRDQKFSNQVNTVFERIGKSRGFTVRNVRGMIASMTGRADLVSFPGVPPVWVPHGTGPRDMSAEQFEGFWEDARHVIFAHILPTLAPDDAADIVRMIESMKI